MAPKKNLINAYKAMKDLGYSQNIVRPIVKQLLTLYEDNWTLIEEDNYKVLIEAILDSEDNKAQGTKSRKPNRRSEDEAEKDEPLVKRPRLNNLQKNQSSSEPINTFTTGCSIEVKNETRGKQTLAEVTPEKHQDEDNELSGSHIRKYYKRKCKNSVEQETSSELNYDEEIDRYCSMVPNENMEYFGEESDLRPPDFTWMGDNETPGDDSFEVPLAVLPPDPPILLLQQSSYENCSDAKESCFKYPEVINLDPDDTYLDMLPKDSCSLGNSSKLEQIHSEPVIYKNPDAEKIEQDGQDSLKLDLATSSKGDSKISISINASVGPEFRVPNIEEVLKLVEDQCIRSYKIPQAGFSLLGIMNEVCQRFLATGTTSANTEELGPENEISALGVSEEPHSEIGSYEDTNLQQLSLISVPTISNDPVTIKNVFEVSSEISRFFGSGNMGLSRPMTYLNMMDASGGLVMTDGEIKEIDPSVACSSHELVVYQTKARDIYVPDITKGHEACEISLINEINEVKGPKFQYIPKSATYMTACMTFPLARVSGNDCCSDCLEDCLSLENPCACAGKTRHEFAYTQGGLLKETFLNDFICKSQSLSKRDFFFCQDCPLQRCENSLRKCMGHMTRDFIKECWYKCGCSLSCGNRVVQRGITAKLQVFMTPEGKGWGLRALEDLPKGAFICEYVGEVVTIKELLERNEKNSNENNHTFSVVLDADWSSKPVLKENEALCLDASFYGNIARFINHRCFDANLVGVPVEMESPDHHYYHLAFFATREINALDELTWDYGVEFDDRRLVKAFECRCGSKFCRDRSSGRNLGTF
ncbi:Histone-lysine N-methyltransferase SUVR2 [Striga hermonthica]|uniref:Histone-lysine N-methyltransferase SUVR2 n=1 Tax=Striga hermonthica TaxID=68872 RepID=A0A9N7MY95_STRHE|nr:Histone-lysine N-methyltransferase SUVR2 [Striga hermonthica]